MKSTDGLQRCAHELGEKLAELSGQLEVIHDLTASRSLLCHDIIQDMITRLTEIDELQTRCENEFEKVFPDRAVPWDLNTLDERIAQHKRSQEKQRRFSDIENVIKRFMSITSDFPACNTLLTRHLDRLRSIADSDISPEDFLKAAQPYEQFYSAVKTVLPSQRSNYISGIQNIFESELLLKLLLGMLYIGSNTLKSSASVNTVKTPESTPPPHFSQAELPEIKYTDDGIYTALRTHFGKVSFECRNENHPVTPKGFTKDMEKCGSSCGISFSILQEADILTPGIVSAISRTDQDFTKSLEQLTKTGYLKKISLEGFEPFYRISSRGVRALTPQNSGWMKSSFGRVCEKERAATVRMDIVEEKRPNAALANLGYARLMEGVYSTSWNLVRRNDICFGCCRSAYTQILDTNGYGVNSWILSVFLPDPDDVEDYKSSVTEFTAGFADEPDVIFIAGENIDECNSHWTYWREHLSFAFDPDTYFYIITENKLFSPADEEYSDADRIPEILLRCAHSSDADSEELTEVSNHETNEFVNA